MQARYTPTEEAANAITLGIAPFLLTLLKQNYPQASRTSRISSTGIYRVTRLIPCPV